MACYQTLQIHGVKHLHTLGLLAYNVIVAFGADDEQPPFDASASSKYSCPQEM